jgi:SAM-dependent methyltransferase
MADELSFAEDLPRLALEASEVAPRLCRDCQNFHLLWPYLRLAGASGGGSVGEQQIQATLRRLLDGKSRRVLVAGAADTALLAVVARAASPGTNIVVLDRCETPLELCRRFARRWSLPIETLHVDLMDFSSTGRFDVVFAHSLLQFIPDDRREDVLSRLQRSLRPDGRLVLVFRTSARIEAGLLPEYREAYPKNLVERLEAMNIALPEPRDDFRRRVETYAEERRAREGAHPTRAGVESSIEAAGFEIEDMSEVQANLSAPFRHFTAKIDKRRFLAIARPSS